MKGTNRRTRLAAVVPLTVLLVVGWSGEAWARPGNGKGRGDGGGATGARLARQGGEGGQGAGGGGGNGAAKAARADRAPRINQTRGNAPHGEGRPGRITGKQPKVTICHHTGSRTNPTVEINVNRHALRGHGTAELGRCGGGGVVRPPDDRPPKRPPVIDRPDRDDRREVERRRDRDRRGFHRARPEPRRAVRPVEVTRPVVVTREVQVVRPVVTQVTRVRSVTTVSGSQPLARTGFPTGKATQVAAAMVLTGLLLTWSSRWKLRRPRPLAVAPYPAWALSALTGQRVTGRQPAAQPAGDVRGRSLRRWVTARACRAP